MIDTRTMALPRSGAFHLTSPLLLVGIAMLAGAVLRFWDLAGVPPALNQDEAVAGYDAYSLWRTGRDYHGHPFPIAGFESFGDWVPPLLSFAMVPAVAVFGLDVEVIRGVAALIGVLGIPVVYLLARELFRRPAVGVIAAWVLALLPSSVHLSRWAIPPTLVPTLVALTMLTLVWSVPRRSSRGIVAAAVVAALTVTSYQAMKFYIPLLGLAALLIYAESISRIGKEALIYAVLLGAVIAGPTLYLTAVDPGGRARFDQTSVFTIADVDAGLLIEQYVSHFSPRFLFSRGDGDPMHLPPGFGVALWTMAPFLLAGLLRLCITLRSPQIPEDRRSALFLLAALLLYPAPGTITLPAPHVLRAAQLIPLLALTTALGAVTMLDAGRLLLRNAGPRLQGAMLATVALVAGAAAIVELRRDYQNYFSMYPSQVLGYFQYGLEETFNYIATYEQQYNEIWIIDMIAAHIYLFFFTEWPPSEVHTRLQVQRNPPGFNKYFTFGTYHFEVLAPDIAPADLTLLHTVAYPNGGIAYQVRGGVVPGRGRVLLVHR